MALHQEAQGKRRNLRAAAGVVVAALFFAGPAPSATAEGLRQPPNSRVAMAVGQTFTASTRFTGFLDEESGASYRIVEMPASSYEEVKKLADRPEALASNGIVETQRGTLAGRTGEYVYVTGRQNMPAASFAKFLLIMRENGVTAMITANIPQAALDAQRITRAEVEIALASATVRRETGKSVELFRLGYFGAFKEVQSLTSTTKAYTLSGRLPERGDGTTAPDPLFIISSSLDSKELPDLAAATLKAFLTLGGYKDHMLISASETIVGALRAHGAIGEGVDKRSGQRSSIYVVIVAGHPGGYYVLVGTCPAAVSAFYLQEFQKMVMSFRPVRQ